MKLRTVLSILFVFLLFLIGFGIIYGAVEHDSDAIGVSVIGGGAALFFVVAAFVEFGDE